MTRCYWFAEPVSTSPVPTVSAPMPTPSDSLRASVSPAGESARFSSSPSPDCSGSVPTKRNGARRSTKRTVSDLAGVLAERIDPEHFQAITLGLPGATEAQLTRALRHFGRSLDSIGAEHVLVVSRTGSEPHAHGAIGSAVRSAMVGPGKVLTLWRRAAAKVRVRLDFARAVDARRFDAERGGVPGWLDYCLAQAAQNGAYVLASLRLTVAWAEACARVGARPVPLCTWCGSTLTGKQRSACSGACRVGSSRYERATKTRPDPAPVRSEVPTSARGTNSGVPSPAPGLGAPFIGKPWSVAPSPGQVGPETVQRRAGARHGAPSGRTGPVTPSRDPRSSVVPLAEMIDFVAAWFGESARKTTDEALGHVLGRAYAEHGLTEATRLRIARAARPAAYRFGAALEGTA